MADSDSITTTDTATEHNLNPSELAFIKLDGIHGLLDCLYTIAVANTNMPNSGLLHTSIISTLKLAIEQVDEAQHLLCEVTG